MPACQLEWCISLIFESAVAETQSRRRFDLHDFRFAVCSKSSIIIPIADFAVLALVCD
jgi:hypothetical protein